EQHILLFQCASVVDLIPDAAPFFLALLINILLKGAYTALTVHEMGDIPFTCPNSYDYSLSSLYTTCQIRKTNLIFIWLFPTFLVFSLCASADDFDENDNTAISNVAEAPEEIIPNPSAEAPEKTIPNASEVIGKIIPNASEVIEKIIPNASDVIEKIIPNASDVIEVPEKIIPNASDVISGTQLDSIAISNVVEVPKKITPNANDVIPGTYLAY
ncbi:19662_t:CDS:2, partial [Dentiscutata erythropus]